MIKEQIKLSPIGCVHAPEEGTIVFIDPEYHAGLKGGKRRCNQNINSNSFS